MSETFAEALRREEDLHRRRFIHRTRPRRGLSMAEAIDMHCAIEGATGELAGSAQQDSARETP